MTFEPKKFIDIQGIIKKIEDRKITKQKLCKGPLFFGLNCFVNQLGSFSESHAEPFDLRTFLT
jgi:hypothetical protein